MIHVTGIGGISAKIVADSISGNNRITTFEIEFPRIILSENNTHKMISKNSSSTRAIPLASQIDLMTNSHYVPTPFTKNQAGMSANDIVEDQEGCREIWERAFNNAKQSVQELMAKNVHKQHAGRLLEPFQMMKVITTATEWDNFFWLRNDENAQPEIANLAQCMLTAINSSTPIVLQSGEWHLPYYENGYWKPHFDKISLENAIKISSSQCAQVSYRKSDDSLEKAINLYDKLINSNKVHGSPFEHQATPMYLTNSANDRMDVSTWEPGTTHMDNGFDLWSANFCGWVQYRKLIKNNYCMNYSGLLK